MTKFAKKTTISVKKAQVKNSIETRANKNALHILETTLNAEQECPTHQLKPRTVTTGVYALLEVIKLRQNEEKKKILFKNVPKDIMLQIIPIKIPITHMQQIRVVLPHSLNVEGSDVCLITQNVKKSTKDDHEPTIAYYKSLLQEKNIKGITEIVPIRQLRSQHLPFEMKGRFADMFDAFLVDGRLFGKVTKFLGSRFFKRNKDLIPVKMNTDNVKRELENALAKTVLTVHGHGDCYSVRVGFSSFTVEQLEANIMAVAEVIARSFPGGLANVRKLLVKSDRSMAIPIYLSLAPHNSVPVPVVRPPLPKAFAPVEGELSTFVGKRVTVMPTGEVILSSAVTAEDVEMDFNFGGEVTVEAGDNNKEGEETNAGRNRKMAAAADSSEEDVEAAEDAYVMTLHRDQANLGAKAQSKETKVSKTTEKEGDGLPRNKSLQVDNSVALDTTENTAGRKRMKKSNTTPNVKKRPKPENRLERIEIKKKKLHALPKAQSGKVKKEIGLKEESKAVSAKRKKSNPAPEVVSGEIRELSAGSKGSGSKRIESPPHKLGEFLKCLDLNSKEGSDVSGGVRLLAKKRRPEKDGGKEGGHATLGSTRKETLLTKAALNCTVMEPKKAPKVSKKNPNRESSRLEMLKMLKQSKIDYLRSKEIKHGNEVDFPAHSKLDTPVIQKGTDKKIRKRKKLVKTGDSIIKNSLPGVHSSLDSPTVETNADKKKKKRDKRDTTNKGNETSPLRLLDFGSPPLIAHANTDKKKKEGDKRERASIGEETLPHPVLPLQCLNLLRAEEKARKKMKKADVSDELTTNETQDAGAAGKAKPTPAATRVQPTRSKKEVCDPAVQEKSEKVKKGKEKSISPALSKEVPKTPNPKKKKQKRDSSGDHMKELTAIKEQAQLSSQKVSKRKYKGNDQNSNKESKTENMSAKVVQVRKSFPRYFSMENQQTLAEYDTTSAASKRRVPQNNRDERIDIGEAMPQYIAVTGKSDIAGLIADARDSGESVITMPMDLVMELQRRREEQRDRCAREHDIGHEQRREDYLRQRRERETEVIVGRAELIARQAEGKARRMRERYLELRASNLTSQKTVVAEWRPRERDRSHPRYNAELRRSIARAYFHLRRRNEEKLLSSSTPSRSVLNDLSVSQHTTSLSPSQSSTV